MSSIYSLATGQGAGASLSTLKTPPSPQPPPFFFFFGFFHSPSFLFLPPPICIALNNYRFEQLSLCTISHSPLLASPRLTEPRSAGDESRDPALRMSRSINPASLEYENVSRRMALARK